MSHHVASLCSARVLSVEEILVVEQDRPSCASNANLSQCQWRRHEKLKVSPSSSSWPAFSPFAEHTTCVSTYRHIVCMYVCICVFKFSIISTYFLASNDVGVVVYFFRVRNWVVQINQWICASLIKFRMIFYISCIHTYGYRAECLVRFQFLS